MFCTDRYIILDVLVIGIAISNWVINLNVTAQLGLSLLESHVPLLRQDLRYSNIDLLSFYELSRGISKHFFPA